MKKIFPPVIICLMTGIGLLFSTRSEAQQPNRLVRAVQKAVPLDKTTPSLLSRQMARPIVYSPHFAIQSPDIAKNVSASVDPILRRIEQNQLLTLKRLTSLAQKHQQISIVSAIREDDLESLKFMVENGIPITQYDIFLAIDRGNNQIIQYLLDHLLARGLRCTREILQEVAYTGNITIFKFLYEQWKPPKSILRIALYRNPHLFVPQEDIRISEAGQEEIILFLLEKVDLTPKRLYAFPTRYDIKNTWRSIQ